MSQSSDDLIFARGQQGANFAAASCQSLCTTYSQLPTHYAQQRHDNDATENYVHGVGLGG